jgi:L-lysine 2,3-aminomutase
MGITGNLAGAHGFTEVERIPGVAAMPPAERSLVRAACAVHPLCVNQYVMAELIHWRSVPDDPIYQFAFPQPGMLAPAELAGMVELVERDADREAVQSAAARIRLRHGPRPSQPMQPWVRRRDGRTIAGIHHHFRETVMVASRHATVLHPECPTCCCPVMALDDELERAGAEAMALTEYLFEHPEATSVYFGGGDALAMSTALLRRHVEPLLRPALDPLMSIRFATQTLAYWPYRFLADPDADDLLRLFDEMVAAGRHVAVMAQFRHPRELETRAAQAAVARIRSTGAIIRCNAPLLEHVNDRASIWATMWALQVRLGLVPYYAFVEQHSGPRGYFALPLARAVEIYREAYQSVSGLCRTVRGPVMNAIPGKVAIGGPVRIGREEAFSLELIEALEPDWAGRPFFARYDRDACWLDDLEPLAGASDGHFFFDRELGEIARGSRSPHWGKTALPVLRPPVLRALPNSEEPS